MKQSKIINNLERILTILTEDKDQLVRELNRVKIYLEKKIHSVNSLVEYKRSYSCEMVAKDGVPSLLKNRFVFIMKLDEAITTESHQVDMLECEKVSCIRKIEDIELKIKAIDIKIKEHSVYHSRINDEISISELNDLSVNKNLKERNHE